MNDLKCIDDLACKADMIEKEDFDARHNTVGYELRSLNNLIHRFGSEKNKKRFGDSYTTEVHLWIIEYLYCKSSADVFQKDLEAIFEVRRSTMTGILQTMEKKGLIVRESVNHDARLKKITLTEKAKQLVESTRKDIEDFDRKIVEGIPEQELKIFFDVIAKIKENIIAMSDE